MKNAIYLDYAATTPVDIGVFRVSSKYYKTEFYNPSSTHILGQRAATAVETAREKCADAINADSNEIIFTSGGTDAINRAMTYALGGVGKHVVMSAIEHDSVFACAEHLKNNGYIIDYVKPTSDGIITPDALEKSMCDDTALVCVMTVNNITGVIQPIKVLCEVAHRHGALFFTDAVQAVNSLDINVSDTDVDMLAVSGHKFYAPKGVGFLYVKSSVKKTPVQFGYGSHEGTPNVPAIVAIGEAMARSTLYKRVAVARIERMRNAFLSELNCGLVVCENAQKIPDIVSVLFDGINGGRLAVALSYAGVCCSVGSACSAGSATPPRALVEMGLDNPEYSVRFSFGKQTTREQVITAANIVNETVSRLKRV